MGWCGALVPRRRIGFLERLETTENGFDALYKTNLKHVLLCSQKVARRLVAAMCLRRLLRDVISAISLSAKKPFNSARTRTRVSSTAIRLAAELAWPIPFERV